MSVYDWHDPWALLAAQQAVTVTAERPTGPPVTDDLGIDPRAREALFALAKIHRADRVRALMQRLKVYPLRGVPLDQQLATVEKLADYL